ncbi:unnamed protein product [Schistocephalus solidus]|uniref:Tubulin monoglycylase TTLL3 n=1 Tax=Schistocephalus solidus TaxID=70667 RepID=A0A183SEA8_SCHSO|nr:unnamed protein product [Schistocephalus solidus]
MRFIFPHLQARSLKATVPNFIWTLKKSQIDFRFLRKDQIVNHHPKAPFTTKVGLCRHLRMVRWFDDIGPESFFPRCYLLSANEEKRSFIDDYQLTAVMAAIKWACNYYQQPRQPKKRIQCPNMRETDDDTSTYDPQVWNSQCEGSVSDSSSGTISATKAITMALRCCDWYLRSMRHEDLDESSPSLHRSYCRDPSPFEEGEPIYQRCQFLCDKINSVNPQFELDGCRNIWIVKPGAKSRGRGITCHRKLDSILALLSNNISSLDNRFVVQKYIEKPLLIFKTKFDIRQWFLVTDWNPLTVWWYQDCYLRFCSNEFTLDHFTFKLHSFLLLQHCFELYGADFMISEDDLRPWLIEINASPCMAPSTSVTMDLAAKVLEDTLKGISY